MVRLRRDLNDANAVDADMPERRSRLLIRRLAIERGLADWQTGGRHRDRADSLLQPERFAFVQRAAIADAGEAIVHGWISSQDQQVAAWGRRDR